MGRLRGLLWGFRGAQIGIKVFVGPRCYLSNPRGLVVGARSVLEGDVRLKIVSPEGRIVIGENVFIGNRSQFDCLDSIQVGDHTLIAPNVFIADHDHGMAKDRRIDTQACVSTPVDIGADVWLGTNVCVLRGAVLEQGAVVGANSIVRGTIEEYSVVAGAPAVPIGKRK